MKRRKDGKMSNRKSVGNAGRKSTSSTQSADDKVGYGNPPKHTRFKPGQTSRGGGRPRGARGRRQIIEKIAKEMITVVENGKKCRRSTLRAIMTMLRDESVNANLKAFRACHALLAKYGVQEPIKRGGYIIVPERLTPEEWNARFAKPKPDSAEE
jgi:hypothetical protein